jgi:hypothetical protein
MRRMVVVSVIAALCLVGITFGITKALDNRPTTDQVQDRQDTALIASCERGNVARRQINLLTIVARDTLTVAADRAAKSEIPGGHIAQRHYLRLRSALTLLKRPDCPAVVLYPTKLR